MKGQQDPAITELLDFLRDYSLRVQLENTKLQTAIRSLSRRLHALLLWRDNFTKGAIWKAGSSKDQQFISYYEECTSDLSQAVFLFSQGLYKPAMLILRSAIENFLKSVGIAEDQKVLSLTSVFDLLDVVKDTKVVTSSKSAKTAFNGLRQFYAELCRHVHTAGPEQMSLTSFVGVFPRYHKETADVFEDMCRRTIVFICQMLCVLFHRRLKKMHHKTADAILDLTPASTKREIAAAAA